MSNESEELKAAGLHRLSKLRHINQVRILAMAKLIELGIAEERRKGEHLDFRRVTPINNRTGQPVQRGEIF
jgi:hypothetical protein